MERLCCPLCGSEYMVFGKGLDKLVFHLEVQGSVKMVSGEAEQEIDLKRLSCGACSWQGESMALVPSRM